MTTPHPLIGKCREECLAQCDGIPANEIPDIVLAIMEKRLGPVLRAGEDTMEAVINAHNEVQRVLLDEETGNGWGPDVTMLPVLKLARDILLNARLDYDRAVADAGE